MASVRVRRHRWLRRVCDVAVRLATVSAGLCPTLSSVGGALVGALVAAAVAVALAEPSFATDGERRSHHR